MARWQPSNLARYLFVAYVLLVVYASLHPFSGWRDRGLPPFAFLTAPFSRPILVFDVVANIIGYMPLGFLAVLAVYPWLRRSYAFGFGLACSVLLSFALESLQLYLPTRASSNLDLLANAVGGAAGALAALATTRPLMDAEGLQRLRNRLFLPGRRKEQSVAQALQSFGVHQRASRGEGGEGAGRAAHGIGEKVEVRGRARRQVELQRLEREAQEDRAGEAETKSVTAAQPGIHRQHGKKAERHVADDVRDDVEYQDGTRERSLEEGKRRQAPVAPAGERMQARVDDEQHIRHEKIARQSRRLPTGHDRSFSHGIGCASSAW